MALCTAARISAARGAWDSLRTKGAGINGFQVLRGTSQITIERTVLAGSVNSALVVEGGDPSLYKDNVWVRGQYGMTGAGKSPGSASFSHYAPTSTWSNINLVGTSNGTYPAGTNWVEREGAVPLAAQIRSAVSAATAGVVTP